jgi:hypothetical protein
MTTETATYIKPTEVLGPKRSWDLFHVLFDGGPSGGDRPEQPGTSLAIGRWNGRPTLAMRWNGNAENPIGNPQSRGIPTWFILPEHDAQQILKSPLYNFSDDKIKFARDFIELKRVYFLTRCPTLGCSNFGNLTLASYDITKVAEYIVLHSRNELKFYCIYCDQQFLPTEEERPRLAVALEDGFEHYRKRGR